jgi:hypothetical protein
MQGAQNSVQGGGGKGVMTMKQLTRISTTTSISNSSSPAFSISRVDIKYTHSETSFTMPSPELLESLKRSLENSKAEYVRLGKSGLKISVPFMGAMSLGPKHWAPWLIEEEEVSRVSTRSTVTDT